MIDPIFCFTHRIPNVLTITLINKKYDYFNDEGMENIPDNLDQEEFHGDEFISLGAKRILLTINCTKTLVKYMKSVS